MVCFFLLELLFYADLLSDTRKVFKEYNMIREADKLKSDRKMVLLLGMALYDKLTIIYHKLFFDMHFL